LAQVLRWEDMLSERKAWDALIWFGALIMMAEALPQQGVITLLSDAVFRHIQGWAWMLAFLLLTVTYLYIHYGFASMTAHILALYPGFLATAIAVGVQPMLAAIALAYFSNLNAGITHYGTGSAPVYFGEGYVSLGQWWKLGFILSLVNLIVWLGLGMVWWKLLGWW
jgi:DASS family divalent anion:Na+ symporter